MARRLMSLLMAAAVVMVVAGTAGATTSHREHYSGTDAFTIDDCGFTINVSTTFSGQVLFREDKDGEAFLVRDTYRYRDVATNPATGEYLVVTGRAVAHELSATNVEGNIYEFEMIEAGQPFVLSDSDGNVIVRDSGVIRRTVTFDTLGDGEPGGQFLDETVEAINGPHPGFADDFDFCGIATELIGPGA
jgi:hypothetical protein